MKALSSRFSGLFRLYRKDDSAPTTIEWILLLVVALIVMVIIYTVVTWISKMLVHRKKVCKTNVIRL